MSTFAVCFNRICEMDFLPKAPAILVSSVNMLLRDEFTATSKNSSVRLGMTRKNDNERQYRDSL